MSKKIYLAAVMVTCYVAGVRTDIQPGGELPDLPEHDIEQLLAMKAITDPAAQAADTKAAQKADRAAGKDFAEAKSKVQAADASTAPQA
jgi:hypothetical protein